MSAEKLSRLASKRGGVCLSPAWLGYQSKHRWRCVLGHEFEASPEQISEWVEWCSECRGIGGSLGERLCRSVLERMFGMAFVRKRPKWLAAGRGGACLELDGYAEADAVAFEYNGRQHYEASRGKGYRYTEERVAEQRERDELKARLCREHGVRLIVVPAFRDLADISGCIDQIEYAVLWAGLKIPRKWRRPESLPELFEPLDRVFGPAVVAQLRQIAAERGGLLLSETATLATEPLTWRCASGHTFHKTAWYVLNKDGWCKYCIQASRRKTPPKAIPVKEWRVLDHGKGEHPERQCSRGHSIRIKPNPRRGEDYCPYCRVEDNVAEQKRLGFARMQRAAIERGGTFPQQEYSGREARHRWRCGAGHDFVEYPMDVLKGKWCPSCRMEREASTKRLVCVSVLSAE